MTKLFSNYYKSMKNRYGIICLLLWLFTSSCVEPFETPAIESPNGLLVVEGFLNSSSGPTVVTVSRTQNLADADSLLYEIGAQVRIESERGITYPLSETGNGTYSSPAVPVQPGEKYRLLIRTRNSQEYVSELVSALQAPPIDTVGWRAENNGIRIFVSTQDRENNTQYYRWAFEETWEYRTPYQLLYNLVGGEPVYPPEPRENINRCWTTEKPGTILIGSSAALNDNLIYEFPITFLPQESIKINTKYSVLVRQYALSKEAYDYWLNLKKNTENLGSLFDPQPSQVIGNIRCVSQPEETVLGYFDVTAATEKRIFIRQNELPKWKRITGYESCRLDSIFLENFLGNPPPDMPVISEIYATGGPPSIIGYLTTTNFCIDCRLQGSNVRPDFWE